MLPLALVLIGVVFGPLPVGETLLSGGVRKSVNLLRTLRILESVRLFIFSIICSSSLDDDDDDDDGNSVACTSIK